MEYLETMSKMVLAGLGVWRVTRCVYLAFDGDAAAISRHISPVRFRPADLLGNRVMDVLYGLGIWMSAQTAVWFACGLGGVLLVWLATLSFARLALRARPTVPVNTQNTMQGRTPAGDSGNGVAELCR